jgi:predicted MPP superfamily phosphohydrolase
MSFCVNGASFEPKEYYRDDDQAGRILLACRDNPVLVTGLRRIGKSWFLRRLGQIVQAKETRHFGAEGEPYTRPLTSGTPERVTILDAGDDDFDVQLEAALASKERGVLAIDELEKLADDETRSKLLEKILRRRLLILAAAPSIHDIARRRAPGLADFFEQKCTPAVLGPLLEFERRALMLQTCDPGKGLPAELQRRALDKAWGGYPLVLQQVGESLQGNPKLKLPVLVDLVHAVLNGAPRFGHSLCETGLTSSQREVLVRIAAGDCPPGDDHTALQLRAHGAIVKKGKGWAVENVVLQRYFDGLPRNAKGGARPEPEVAKFVAPPALRAPVRVFTWIHLSDLHFGAGSVKHRFDHRTVMSAIVRDIKAHAPLSVDRILVTGDVAYSAKPGEYAEASTWLRKTADAAGVGIDRVRLVPGNHDVDRALAGKVLARSVHHSARTGEIDLDTLLDDAEVRDVLARKLGAYRSFAGSIAGHPAPLANGLDWFERIAADPARHGPIRLIGLSTVWISDEQDGIPNMMLALGPIEATCGDATADEIAVVLSHHPPEWIQKESASLLERELARLSHLHLCGHVHDAGAGATKRFGGSRRAIRYVAGAAHGDPSESAKHGYAWGAIRYEPKAGWQAGWAPRVYVAEHGEMRADAVRNQLEADGFAWEDIDCRWSAPT